jgi:hypothetical protein
MVSFCKKCNEVKDNSEFYAGNLSNCKSCKKAKRTAHLNINDGQKCCQSCSKFKELSMFSKTKATRDGYKYRCDFCLSNKQNIILGIYMETSRIKELFPERFANGPLNIQQSLKTFDFPLMIHELLSDDSQNIPCVSTDDS